LNGQCVRRDVERHLEESTEENTGWNPQVAADVSAAAGLIEGP